MEKTIGDFLFKGKSDSINVYKDFKLYKEGYRKKDIVKRIMGGKLYYDYMLDDNYDESWNEFDNLI